MNIGIIGLGFMGATHLVAWSKLPQVRIQAIASRNTQAQSGDFSNIGGNLGLALPPVDLSAATKYLDWQTLLTDPAVDAVDICLPTDLHVAVAVAALEAGKHVLCEKPMALDSAGCARILEAAAAARRILMIGHVLRFWPAYTYLQDFAQSGRYGVVQSATFTRLCGLPDWSDWLPNTSKSGGALLDLLIHDLDQILLLFGPPAAVRAKALGTVDAVTASLLYPGGPEVRLQGGWMAGSTPFSMAFQVRTNAAQLELASGHVFLSDAAGRRDQVELADTDPYLAQLAYFRHCCDAGEQPERCPPQQSAAAVKLAGYVRQSRSLDGELVTCDL